jgi:hypothetical protein
MPRAWIWLLSFLYLVMAVAFSAYEAIQNPHWKLDGHTIGRMIGGGLFIYGASAVVPVIAWGFARFRQGVAPPVFVTWLVIGVVLAYLSDTGNRLDRTAKIAKLTSSPVFSGKDRDDFERSVKLGCEQSQRANTLTAAIGISEAKITVYCECIAAGLAEAISLEELRYAVSNGKPPASLLDKRTVMSQFCSAEVLQN